MDEEKHLPENKINSENNSLDSKHENYDGCIFYKFNNKKDEYEFISPSFEALTGFSMHEINSPGHHTFVKEIFNRKQIVAQKSNANIIIYRSEYIIETKQKEYKKIEENTFIELDENKNELSTYGVLNEKNKDNQEAVELIKKLQHLNATKDKLISHISHDLRSPFNSLLGFSEILTTEYDSLTKDEIHEYLNVIYEASKNLFGMTNNLLQFSRFQMGSMEFKPSNVNLKRLINRSLNLLKGNAIKKQIAIVVEADENINVFADEDMLSSIIQNLVSNSIKFSYRRGEVKILAKLISDDESKTIEITVIDSGIGIGKENLLKIFETSFYSTPGTEREYGSGLGLLLVKEFVEKNGGQLNIRSIPNIGSEFSFTLPAAKE